MINRLTALKYTQHTHKRKRLFWNQLIAVNRLDSTDTICQQSKNNSRYETQDTVLILSTFFILLLGCFVIIFWVKPDKNTDQELSLQCIQS